MDVTLLFYWKVSLNRHARLDPASRKLPEITVAGIIEFIRNPKSTFTSWPFTIKRYLK